MRILFLFVLLLNGHTVLARSCNQAVGIESGKILDQAFTASSSYNKWHGPHQARLNNVKSNKGEGAWCSKNNTIGNYIQVDLGSVRELTRIGTQGRNTTYFMYVSKYKLQYSTVGIAYDTFPKFVGSLEPKIFNANNDKNTIVYNDLKRIHQPIRARYVRIFPQAFYGKMCLRFELYECIGAQESCSDKNGGCSHECSEFPPGTVVCKCPSGYKLQDDGKTCKDENECAGSHGCNGTCVNTAGSYHCACPHGMKVGSDGKSCIDINECSPGRDPCDPHSTICVNEIGSYKCQCKPGFKPGFGKHSCQDINECDQGNDLCDRTTTICRNRIGYYVCECRTGHSRVSEHRCRDIDECSLDKDDCSHGCANTIGSFRCTCPTGYVISASNSKQCVDRNECLSANGGCEWYCKNTVGSYQCSCKSGYVLADDKHKCQDVNECSNEADNKCDRTSTNCNNYGGGYQCDCKSGYKYIQGNKYKCELRDCPPLVLSQGTSVSPLACLRPGVMKVGSTCKFSCHSGHKLPTSKDTLNCLASGRWDAANIACHRTSCPALTAPANGDLYPKSCKDTGAKFQGKCYYSCSQGFTLSGVSTKTCQSDSSWDSQQTPTCTRIYAKPWVTCPSNVITTLPPGAREADVTLLLGSAKSNYQKSVKIFPSQYSGKLVFPAGKTTLYFVASNPIGETANCSITINVMDKEAPKAVSYPSNQYLVTKGVDAVATWDAPKFSDNVGVVRVTSSKNSGDKFPLGSITVYITAYDATGNSISVSFEVQVKKAECPVAVPPENGKVNCNDISGFKYCSVVCNSGKKLFKSTYGMSCGSASLVWNPPALPDCVDYAVKTDGGCPNGKIPQAPALQGYPVENVCVNCPKGMYYKEGSKTCENCTKGYISTMESSRVCSKCPSGSSTMVEGAKTCKALCKPGTSSPSGFDQFSIQKPCNLCHIGRYQDQMGSTTCKTCPTGLTTLTKGAKAVSECGGPPKITLFGPSPVNVTEKNQASFECRALGSPQPVFNVTKLKEPPHGYGGARKVEHITEDGKQVGVRFTILRALELDGGVYACQASNPFGYDVKYLQVNVKLNIIHGRRRRMLRESP